jgi:hypothetical protein
VLGAAYHCCCISQPRVLLLLLLLPMLLLLLQVTSLSLSAWSCPSLLLHSLTWSTGTLSCSLCWQVTERGAFFAVTAAIVVAAAAAAVAAHQ